MSTKIDLSHIVTEEKAAEKLAESRAAYEKLTKKGSKSKKWMSILLLAVNVVVVAVIAALEFGGNKETVPFKTVFSTWGMNWPFLICILGMIIIYYLTDILRSAVLIKNSTGHFHFKEATKSSLLCKYYDNITPFGSGGQPFQMYYLSKSLPIGVATSLPLIILSISQIVFFIIAVVNFIIFPSAVSSYVKIASYFGVFLYILVPIAVLFFSLMPKLMSSILKWLLKIGVKLKLIKDYDKKLNKTLNTLTEYRLVFKDLGKSFWTIFICAALSVLHHYSIMSIPYFVMRVSGINVSWVEITVMTIYIYAAITFIPTPGNSGAAEGTFYALFSILQGGYLFWGMMLWRFSVFYLIIIVGLVLIFVDYVIRFKRISRVTAELEAAENRHKEIIESNRKQ